MRILVTNDDGISSEYIKLLAKTATKFGEVVVVAPKNQCSAMSQHITLRRNMEISEYDMGIENVKAYAIDGSPADCVRTSFLGLFKEKFDLVLSGINEGANCGFDIQYSATVGAGLEATTYGVKTICLSQHIENGIKNDEVLNDKLSEIIDMLIDKKNPDGCLFNVNFPACSLKDFKGIVYDRKPAGVAFWDDQYEVITNENGQKEITLKSWPKVEHNEGTDTRAIHDGFISIGIIKNFVFEHEHLHENAYEEKLKKESYENDEKYHEYMHEHSIEHSHEYDYEHNHNHEYGHTHTHTHENSKAVINRFARAIGHLESVKRMVENNRDCSEVLIQLAAVQAALNNTGKIILKDHINHCIVDAVKEGDMGELDELNKAIDRFMK